MCEKVEQVEQAQKCNSKNRQFLYNSRILYRIITVYWNIWLDIKENLSCLT